MNQHSYTASDGLKFGYDLSNCGKTKKKITPRVQFCHTRKFYANGCFHFWQQEKDECFASVEGPDIRISCTATNLKNDLGIKSFSSMFIHLAKQWLVSMMPIAPSCSRISLMQNHDVMS